MEDYKPSSYFAFFDKLEVVHKSNGIRKNFMDFWNKNSDAIKKQLVLDTSDTDICFSATTGNTAISKKNIDAYKHFVLGIHNEDTGKWTVYTLKKEILKEKLRNKDRLNINTGNVEKFVFMNGNQPLKYEE